MTQSATSADLRQVAAGFDLAGPINSVTPFGAGNINDSYLVTTAMAGGPYLLQRINQNVFPRPDWIMANLTTLHAHIKPKLALPAESRRWDLPAVMRTPAGADHVLDEAGEFWRLQEFVLNSRSFAEVRDSRHAEEAGYAVARFHRLVADLEPRRLFDTLPGFHITPRYLADFQKHLSRWPSDQLNSEERFCLEFVAARQARVTILATAQAQGHLPERVIHGDPKVDNILIDEGSDEAVTLIDLDTAKPGLVHYDIGDMIRSGCNPLGELVSDWQAVRFELDLCQAIMTAYCREATFLTAADYAYMGDAIWLLSFEMGLRFFSDYLNDNVYFNVAPDVNLQRALVQFQLTSSIEAQSQQIQRLLHSFQ